jgi:hypothetical protein
MYVYIYIYIHIQALTLRKVQGGIVLSSVLSFAFPDPQQWPLVGLNGFADTASKIAQLASTGALGFMPLVSPEVQPEFEAHAADLFNRTPGYPEGAGKSDFGFVGVWSTVPKNATYPDGHVHHTPNQTDWGTTHQNVSFVVLQHNIVPSPSLMFDIHSEVFRGTALDRYVVVVHANVCLPFLQTHLMYVLMKKLQLSLLLLFYFLFVTFFSSQFAGLWVHWCTSSTLWRRNGLD